MTEEEAKTKWCQAIRFGDYGCNSDAQTVIQDGVQPFYRCIGSDCVLGCDDDGNWLGRCGLRAG